MLQLKVLVNIRIKEIHFHYCGILFDNQYFTGRR